MVSRWFDIRPGEGRSVLLSFLGAAFVISFLILSRSLAESLYLEAFPVTTLPYITAGSALLGIPAVGFFSRLMARGEASSVFRGVVFFLAAVVGVLVPFVTGSPAVVVLFSLTVSLGAMLLTAGFWIVTAEQFPLRSAKRLFGLISAGGTLGAMVTGTSLKWLTKNVEYVWLVAALVGILLLCFFCQILLPRKIEKSPSSTKEEASSTFRENLSLIWRLSHLRYLALIVATATIASTLIDYQFKEFVKGTLQSKEALAGFFGAFYGWTGGVSLAIQILVASKIISRAGLAITLSILPLLLLLGSAGMLVAPALLVATFARGADNSLRKSLHRSAIEVLYVPLATEVRKKTKTFVDSTLNSGAETVGAGIIFLWVTWGGFPSRFLSLFVVGASVAFLFLNRRIGREYKATLTARLKEGGELVPAGPLESRDLLSVAISREALFAVTPATSAELGRESSVDQRAGRVASEKLPGTPFLDPRPQDLRGAGMTKLGGDDTLTLIEHLGQDRQYEAAIRELETRGASAKGLLIKKFLDPSTDFIVRRRIPRLLANLDDAAVEEALLDGLLDNRFEIRFRSAVALSKKRSAGLKTDSQKIRERVFQAIMRELGRDRAVLEFQQILDRMDSEKDEFVMEKVGKRGELSLEHIFRLLSLAEDPVIVRAAYQGISSDDEKVRSFALEYLEQILSAEIQKKLWPFIGDLSDHQKARAQRPTDAVVKDLLATSVTLFADEKAKAALKKMLSS